MMLAERQGYIEKSMMELANSVDQMAEIIQQFSVVGERMKETIQSFSHPEDDMGASTQAIATDDSN